MDFFYGVGAGQDENVVVPFQLEVVITEAIAPVVVLRESQPLDEGGHRAVEDEDVLTSPRFEEPGTVDSIFDDVHGSGVLLVRRAGLPSTRTNREGRGARLGQGHENTPATGSASREKWLFSGSVSRVAIRCKSP